MEIKKLLGTISAKPMRVKEIIASIDKLNVNNSDLETYLMNDSSEVTEFEVASELLQLTTKLIEQRISLDITKNVYDQYSIMFVVEMLKRTKSEKSKLERVYFDVIKNTSKFDIFVKTAKTNRRLSGDSTILELFWLMPLFSNISVLLSLDYSKFISEMKGVSGKVPEFVLGYSYYTTCDTNQMDKIAYKQFLVDGLKEAQVQKV